MDFKHFDRRHYPTVGAKEGYGAWAATYEAAVPDQLDVRVLESLRSLDWAAANQCLDLACGTGRIGEWLKRQGIRTIDGIDLTPEMLERARGKNLYRSLVQGSVEHTALAGGAYDLLVMSLVDEHLASLQAVYREAHRLSAPQGRFVVVGMHPCFFMTGMPTHFKDADGTPKAIETHIHLVSDHVRAAFAAGWNLRDMHEGLIDADWIRVKPKWSQFENYPVNFGYVWERS